MPPRFDRIIEKEFAGLGQSAHLEILRPVKESARLPVGDENDYDPVEDLFEAGEDILEIRQAADALALLDLKEFEKTQ